MIALYAAFGMLVQDILGALLTQAQARDKARLAGLLDASTWLIALLTLDWSLNAINSHNEVLRWSVIGAVSVANYVGSNLGTRLGARLVKVQDPRNSRGACCAKVRKCNASCGEENA